MSVVSLEAICCSRSASIFAPISPAHGLARCSAGAKSEFEAVVWSGFLEASMAIVLSPLLGFVLALVLMGAVSWIFFRGTPLAVDTWLRTPRFGLAATTHKKTMGVISVLLYSQGYVPKGFYVPRVLSCRGAMTFGTLFDGWRVVNTIGAKITWLMPMRRALLPREPSSGLRRSHPPPWVDSASSAPGSRLVYTARARPTGRAIVDSVLASAH